MNVFRFTCQRSLAKVIELFCTVNPDDVMNLLFTRKFNETLIFVHTCRAQQATTKRKKIYCVFASSMFRLFRRAFKENGMARIRSSQRHSATQNSLQLRVLTKKRFTQNDANFSEL